MERIYEKSNGFYRRKSTSQDYVVHSISRLVHCIKQFTTYYMWKRHSLWLSRFYWNKHYLWTRGYFSNTIGNVSDTTLEMYIKNQG
mgnify:CR=1 FL=1